MGHDDSSVRHGHVDPPKQDTLYIILLNIYIYILKIRYFLHKFIDSNIDLNLDVSFTKIHHTII